MAVFVTLKIWFAYFLLVVVTFSDCHVPQYETVLNKIQSEKAPASTQERASYDVLARLLPSHLSSFEFRIITKECGGKFCFLLQNHPSAGVYGGAPEIRISGTTGVELCAGLHWYLKHWCNGHISWDKTGGAQLHTVHRPGFLPRLQGDTLTIQRPVDWNYYQNVVTSSYSYVWWTWERWEKEIDWMALQGINLPLAFTGQEAVWQKVFQSETFNLTKAELDDYFGGPGFLAWARMGNLKRWGGPLPQKWLDQQLQLQIKILARMRELGMTPVLPAFAGNVPAAITKKYPSARVTRLGEWNTVNGDTRYCCTFLLDPKDPLFVDIGKAFILQQIKEYGGTQHIYNCDTFNENQPPTDDPSYISALGSIVYEAMSAADQDAIWLMQGWLFASDDKFWKPPQMKALLHSVPVGRMVVLDLFADVKPMWSRSDHFYGVPYIWCMLHNFGGNVEMYGRLDVVATAPIQAVTSSNSTMVGVGMCMEGIEQNPVVYDLMAEMAFHNATVVVEDWIEEYARRRYGELTAGARIAWKMLHESIYNCSDGIADHNGDVIVEFPDIDPKRSLFQIRPRQSLGQQILGHPQHIWYSPQDAAVALQYLLSSADALGLSKPYRYDVVDLTRQVLSKLANQLHSQVLDQFRMFNVEKMDNISSRLLELLSDMDDLLGASEEFLLGTWLESAKDLATSDEERKLYEWNARTQITMWFDNTLDKPSPLHDYANKMWSGLTRDYYLPRASIYIKYLKQSLHENTSFAFQEWRREWIALTNEWQVASNLYPTVAKGDALEIATTLYEKYADLIVDDQTPELGIR
uniref:Alpha-N-acetylglucosaminidase n=1 Tax=Physcomitrium patens TaxID=3218 RepID=A0A7I4B8L3_PHYPA